MLRFRDIRDAKAAESYYSKSDASGYYLDAPDLHREVGGKAAKELGLPSAPDYDQFKNLLKGFDPHTGEQLTAKLVDGRIAGWDITASIPKGVTIALERGDKRIHDALWEAGREAMADIEQHMTTRQRKGGAQENRVTGNMIWYGFEHPETRPAREDGMPDPDRHIHFVIPNLTYDPVEHEWKAIKFRPIMDLRKYFDRRFDMRLASKLTDLGYEVETKLKPDGKGGKRYFSWDIKGVPETLKQKFSRRANEVEVIAEKLGITNAMSKDKLGATSRLHKRDDMTLADYRDYWNKRVTPGESRAMGETIKSALLGENPVPQNTADKGVAYAVQHAFERKSVVDYHDLAISAMERCMGGAHPDDILPEAKRQGMLLKNGEATTRDVLAEESRIIAFARAGRGMCTPLASHVSETKNIASQNRPDSTDKLSPDQAAICDHVWKSPDRVILIRGGAGTGKTHTMKAAIAEIDKPVVVLAPSAEASRGVLRKEGFDDADTVSRFLKDPEYQAKARNGVIWVDEAGLMGIRQVREVFNAAEKLNARVVLQGDQRQHGSVERGATLRVLEEFGGLPVAELKDIRRQGGAYKSAVESLSKGDVVGGFDKLNDMGWVKQVTGHKPLVDDYIHARVNDKSVLVVAPTHAEGDEITADIRERLKAEGVLGKERTFEQLKPLGWTEAERGDLDRYEGTEVMQFHQKGGDFNAGQKVRVADWKPGQRFGKTSHFSVYAPSQIAIAPGDVIRITANGKSKDGHKLNNGSQYTVRGFNKDGDIVLGNNWVVGKDFGHVGHGYVTTSHASQGKTVDRVLIAMGKESLPAINAEQFYVSASRGRERATIYSDMPADALREAVQKMDARKSATELLTPRRKPKRKDRVGKFMKRVRDAARELRDKAVDAMRDGTRIREPEYAR